MRLLVAAFLLCFPATGVAQSSSFSVLKIAVSPEAGAMGDARVAAVDDAYATLSNPAGLAATPTNSAAVAHHIWVGSTRTYAAVSQYTLSPRVSVGAFLVAADAGASNLESVDPGGGTQSLVTGLAAAQRVGPLRIGVVAKFLSERVIETPSRGFAMDAGMQAVARNGSIRVGLVLQNLGRVSEISAVVTRLPRIVQGGIAVYPFRVISFEDAGDLLNAQIVVEVSRILPDDRTQVHVGAAAQVLEMLTARAGFVTNDELRGFTAGLGLDVSPLNFDYALVPFSQGFGGPGHQLSLIYVW